ncbi:MAG: hypothetical protein ACD_73C00319G0002 [uncultured bacterium]|nr:MAG: hypothetical protein ACD_73C00319G0002 [uncultured bacterium]
MIGKKFDRTCDINGPKFSITSFYHNGKITNFVFDAKGTPYAVRLLTNFKGVKGAKGNEGRAAALEKLAKITTMKPQDRINHMAKVIFAETGGQMANAKASNARDKFKAQYLVASIIANRVDKPSFGNPPLAYAACDDRTEFSCINSTVNANWVNAGDNEEMSAEQKETWEECLKIAAELENKTFKPVNKNIVYFHATSRGKPADWDNKYFMSKLEIEFAGHKYYSTQARQEDPKANKKS